MDIPVTIVNVIAVTYADRIPAYVDQVETFLFFGIVTAANHEEVTACAYELVQECTDQLDDEHIFDALHTEEYGMNRCVEFPDGNVSIHWEQRL